MSDQRFLTAARLQLPPELLMRERVGVGVGAEPHQSHTLLDLQLKDWSCRTFACKGSASVAVCHVAVARKYCTFVELLKYQVVKVIKNHHDYI